MCGTRCRRLRQPRSEWSQPGQGGPPARLSSTARSAASAWVKPPTSLSLPARTSFQKPAAARCALWPTTTLRWLSSSAPLRRLWRVSTFSSRSEPRRTRGRPCASHDKRLRQCGLRRTRTEASLSLGCVPNADILPGSELRSTSDLRVSSCPSWTRPDLFLTYQLPAKILPP